MTAQAHKTEGSDNTDPCLVGFSITPDDAAELAHATRMLRVNGTAGAVKVDMFGSGTLILNMGAGEWLPLSVRKVYLTGTTATDIQGFY